MTKMDPLETQIAEARRTISSDSYPISIGELTNLYRDGELNVRPEFQRFFRWTDTQKSRLVESILLGIPIPSIFVAQTEDGTWELVDGLQRVSTILQLQGLLLDGEGEQVDPLVLQGTKYLPDLQGRRWESKNKTQSLSQAQRLDIKRAKLDVKIIKRESSPATKYDLFQRLNSYGMSFTAQEMRSALLISVSGDFFSWLERLASHESFVESVALSDRLLDEKYDLELVLRWLVLHNKPREELAQQKLRDFPQFMDDESIKLAQQFPNDAEHLAQAFTTTFDVIAAAGEEDVLRKWDAENQTFRGGFLNTAFEVFALGIGYYVANGLPYRQDVMNAVKEFWSREGMASGFATGKSTEARLARFVPEGRLLMKAA